MSGGCETTGCHCSDVCFRSDIFVLDEPTTGMDATTKSDFYELMYHSKYHHQKSVLMITHDPEEVNQFADQIFIWFVTKSLLGDVLMSMILKGVGDHAFDLFSMIYAAALLAMAAMSLFLLY